MAAARTEVAVGIVLRPQDGALLLTCRPPGKPLAGWWEFPGGKVEAGETVQQALARELHEEIGIHVACQTIQPWKTTECDYPHARVRLHWCKVAQWSGTLHMREGQHMAWQHLPLTVAPVLAGTVQALQWLAQERACG